MKFNTHHFLILCVNLAALIFSVAASGGLLLYVILALAPAVILMASLSAMIVRGNSNAKIYSGSIVYPLHLSLILMLSLMYIDSKFVFLENILMSVFMDVGIVFSAFVSIVIAGLISSVILRTFAANMEKNTSLYIVVSLTSIGLPASLVFLPVVLLLDTTFFGYYIYVLIVMVPLTIALLGTVFISTINYQLQVVIVNAIALCVVMAIGIVGMSLLL